MINLALKDLPLWSIHRMALLITGATGWRFSHDTGGGPVNVESMALPLGVQGVGRTDHGMTDLCAAINAQIPGGGAPSGGQQAAINALLAPEFPLSFDASRASEAERDWVPVTILAASGPWAAMNGQAGYLAYSG